MRVVQLLGLVSFFCLWGCGDSEQSDPDKTETDQPAVVAPKAEDKKDKDQKPAPQTDADKDTSPKPPEQPTKAPKATTPLNVAFIPQDAVAAVFVHPQRMAAAPAIKPLVDDPFVRDQILPNVFDFGFHPLDAEELVVIVAAPLSNAWFNPESEEKEEEPIEKVLPDELNANPEDGPIDEPPAPETADEPEPEPKEPVDPKIIEPDFSNLFEGLEPEKEANDPDKPGVDPPPEPPPAPKTAKPPILIPYAFGVVVRFVDEESADAFVDKFRDRMIQDSLDDKTYLRQDYPLELPPLDPRVDKGLLAVHVADKRTVVFAEEEMLLHMMSASDVKSHLVQRLKTLNANNDIVAAVDVKRLAKDEQFTQLLQGLDHPGLQNSFALLDSISVSVDLRDETLATAIAVTADADEATKTEQVIGEAVTNCRQLVGKSLEEDLPPAQSLPLELAKSLLDATTIASDERQVQLALKKPALFDELPDILAPILPGIKANAKTAERLSDLRQLAVAVADYTAAQEELLGKPAYPPAWLPDSEGKPLLSWRVMLLPFLGKEEEEEELYLQFRRNEPWDSAHNIELLDRMPSVFGNGGETNIMLFVGEGTAFVAGKAPSPFEITDGTANTILLVRTGVDKKVPWTKPADVVFDPKNPLAALGQISESGIDVAMFDARVMTLPKDIDAETLRKLIGPNDSRSNDPDN